MQSYNQSSHINRNNNNNSSSSNNSNNRNRNNNYNPNQYYPQSQQQNQLQQQQQQNQQNPTTVTTRKPPRPPPLSVSQPDYPNPDPTSGSQSLSSESPHSPLNSESPLRSDDPNPKPTSPPASPSPLPSPLPLVPAPEKEKYYSPLTSPLPPTPPNHIISFSRREERERAQPGVVYSGGPPQRKGKRVGFLATADVEGRGSSVSNNVSSVKEEGRYGYEGGGRREKVGLGLRVLEIVFCLVSFSVMATDKTQGWSGDSFDRYREYRY